MDEQIQSVSTVSRSRVTSFGSPSIGDRFTTYSSPATPPNDVDLVRFTDTIYKHMKGEALEDMVPVVNTMRKGLAAVIEDLMFKLNYRPTRQTMLRIDAGKLTFLFLHENIVNRLSSDRYIDLGGSVVQRAEEAKEMAWYRTRRDYGSSMAGRWFD